MVNMVWFFLLSKRSRGFLNKNRAKKNEPPRCAGTRQRTIKIPGNIRTVSIRWNMDQAENALVDDFFFCADLPDSLDVNKELTTKYGKDDHTLLFCDFDGQGEYAIGTAKLTDDKSGRFGKGVRLDEKNISTVTIPLSLVAMPPEGTLEFWISYDEVPKHISNYFTMLFGGQPGSPDR